METLLQKAQRLGIQPAGKPTVIPIISERRQEIVGMTQEAIIAKEEAEQKGSFMGQLKSFGEDFVKRLGELTGITPIGKRITAGVAPYVVPKEELPSVVEELAGGVITPQKGTLRELAEIGIDLPLISLGLSKTISGVLEKQAIKTVPELANFLKKPLLEFAPDAVKKILRMEISTPIKEGIETITEKVGKIGEYAKKPFTYLASRFPRFLGMVTGESTDVVELALKNPNVADLGIKQGDVALRKAVQEGSDKSIKLRESFIKGHSEAMRDKVFKDMAVSPGYAKDMQAEITKHFSDLLKANRVRYDNVNKVLDFTTSSIKANPGEITKVQAAYEAIFKWKNWSQSGIHELKQLIGQLTQFPTEVGGRAKSPMLGRMYGFLNEKVKQGLAKERIPIYEELNKKFSENIELFDDMVDAFNSGDPFTKLANVFGKNKDSLRMIIDAYEKQTGQSILSIIAGRELAMEKQAAFGFLNPRTWIDILFSPQKQAEMVTKLGKLNIPEVMKGVK